MTETPVAIRVEGLGKRYRIGQRETYRSLRDSVVSAVTAPTRWFHKQASDPPNDTFWALKDVSLEVKRGEIIGVIGHNGAGKSTLLKILSRISEPTEGRVEVRGRVGSLLEVGTGFHPELTGRENIYLNGAILGMKRAEIARKFDEMVAFAEVERFIDTPVKHFSSGMYLRLAFSVAAHLEPEVLLVDEVLAVGDAAFQKKCIGKMGDVARQGRTILFVSHNLPAIEKLCQRAVIISAGHIVMQGDPVDCIATYLGSKETPSGVMDLRPYPRHDPRLTPVLAELELVNGAGEATASLGCGEPVTFRIAYSAPAEISNPSFGIIISNAMGMPLFFLQTRAQLGVWDRAPASGEVFCHLPELPLVPGDYLLTLGCSSNDRQLDLLEQVAGFNVEPRDFFRSGYLPHQLNGQVLIRSSWDLSGASAEPLVAAR